MLQRIVLLVVCMLSMSLAGNAQQHHQKSDPKLKAIKVALISDRMALTPEQSAKFWPVYNRYEDEMRLVWREKRALNDAENKAKDKVDRLQALEEKKVQIRGKYKNEFLSVVSADQLAAMYSAEIEFKNMLLKRLRK